MLPVFICTSLMNEGLMPAPPDRIPANRGAHYLNGGGDAAWLQWNADRCNASHVYGHSGNLRGLEALHLDPDLVGSGNQVLKNENSGTIRELIHVPERTGKCDRRTDNGAAG